MPRHLESYLGDGAYVYLNNWGGVVFYTSDGRSEIDSVVIDAADLKKLKRWLKEAEEFVAVARERQQEDTS